LNDQTDSQLLRAYAERRSEPAFAELVRRHLDFVYSAARRMVCDSHLAEDVAQSVFLALAANATQLTERPVLSGWLHRTAQNIAAQTVRTDVRRRAREQEAVAMNELPATESDAVWEHIAPHLDAALGNLNDADRDAVLLRYFERKSAREMAQTLGISDAAAQRRVSRAVERLREFFAQRGVTVGASGLAVVLSATAVQAAPAGLAVTISAAAAVAGTTIAVTASATATQAIAMTTLQKALVTVTVAAAIGTGIFETRQAFSLRTQVQALQQQQAPLTQQIQLLQSERDGLANRLSALADEIENGKGNSSELQKLRGEVSRLRGDSQELAQLKATEANDPAQTELKSWLARVKQLKQGAESNPNLQIPELQLLTEQEWLQAAKWFGRRPQFDAETDFRIAMAEVRQSAQNAFAARAQQGLKEYTNANDGRFPTDLAQLKTYFKPPIDDAILRRYKIAPAEEFGLKEKGQDHVLTQRELVDEEYDHPIGIGPGRWGYKQSVAQKLPSDLLATKRILDPAAKEFSVANNGQEPTDPSQLLPYVKTSEQQAALQKAIERRKTLPNRPDN
jgi:RNA polymerase sigma factor (sigma-70 family)